MPAPLPASNGPGAGEPPVGERLEPVPGQGGEWDGSAGYLLTPRRASFLTVLVILLMALSFVGGLLIGRFIL